MRYIRSRSAVALLVLFALACATTVPGKQYQSISACNASAQSLVKSFGLLYQANKASDPVLWGDRYDKATKAYEAYQKIALAAVDAAKAGGETTLILAAVNEALSQLTQLLVSYGVVK